MTRAGERGPVELKGNRQDAILRAAAKGGGVSVGELSRKFGVSRMTIRRDLAELSRNGRLNRIHGGAVPSRAGVIDFDFREKGNDRAPQKLAVARAVAEMIKPGMAVVLDTGTTTLEVAKAIAGRRDIRVLTSSLAAAAVLHSSEGIELVLLGGTARRNSPDLAGPLAEENLRRFQVNLAVLGADAVTPEGAFTDEVGAARLCQAMVSRAGRTVLAVDSSKFSRTAFVRHTPLSELDCIVTDNGCPRHVREWLGKKVRHVVYAPPAE